MPRPIHTRAFRKAERCRSGRRNDHRSRAKKPWSKPLLARRLQAFCNVWLHAKAGLYRPACVWEEYPYIFSKSKLHTRSHIHVALYRSTTPWPCLMSSVEQLEVADWPVYDSQQKWFLEASSDIYLMNLHAITPCFLPLEGLRPHTDWPLKFRQLQCRLTFVNRSS